MKKLLSIILLLCTLCALASCSTETNSGVQKETNPESTSGSQPETTEPDKKEEAFAIGDVVRLNDWNITVNSFSFEEKIESTQYTSFKPDEGNSYLVIDITVKNIGDVANTFIPTVSLKKTGAKIIYDGTYEFSGTNLLGYDKDLHDKHINPLADFNGILAFQVSNEVVDSDKPLVIRITDNNVDMNVNLRDV